MTMIDWGGSLLLEKQAKPEAHPHSRLWTDLCRPKTVAQMQGNAHAIGQMNAWFGNRLLHRGGNSCLVVQGPAGVGKSTAVELLLKEGGFNVEHTYANVSRTPQKLESSIRKLTMHCGPSVLVLDDFESFISETTSMRDIVKFARSVAPGKGGSHAKGGLTVVIICNGMDKSFKQLFATSTIIEFEHAETSAVQRALQRVARSVSAFAYIPPMDVFFIAHGSSGDIAQTINQMQFTHNRKLCSKKKGTRGIAKLGSKCQADSALRNWATTHRASSVHCFTETSESVIDHIWAMSKGFHMDARDNLHTDYPLYFHNATATTLHGMWKVAEEVSACDIAGPDEEDALYTTENRELWGRDNSYAVAHISTGLWMLQGRQRWKPPVKKRKLKKPFTYC